MEIAGHWRREWAGTAEYGKIIEGGVTRRVARAMEVLHASAPGAKVRVMRAAYHSTAGPGLPASSYLMHSSRQVLSSGNHYLEPPPLRIKPLEISSTPLESSPDSEAEREDYKVTEPDDFDISEPSKWKGSLSKNSIRMPSEESSSADNASIIDLDPRSNSRNSYRRSFRRKDDHMLTDHRHNSRISPLLDAPVALSTLKYTSLLNGSEDWNNRRKSYSFEDSAPIQPLPSKNILQQNERLKLDSSTDSGICKSSEIVDDQKNYVEKTAFGEVSNTFQDWLSKNRSYKMKPIKLVQPSDDNISSNIALKSTGKVTITLPVTIETDKSSELSADSHEENERKIKRVEFCKTELHFAAESGTVNIIATDEKPPPSNDFRKKRSAFVPLNDRFEKSITLFGDRNEQPVLETEEKSIKVHNDENTAATKSILKNKIPKPKPYLLGENMAFRDMDDSHTNDTTINSTQSSVSIINRQLQSGRHNRNILSSLSDVGEKVISHEVLRTISKGLHTNDNVTTSAFDRTCLEVPFRKTNNNVTPNQRKIKSRELRETDLPYFGINYNKNNEAPSQDNLQEEIFHSVKLVQQVSNSMSNSEIDSDEGPEYENLSTSKIVPIPKPRSKFKKDIIIEPRTLKPIPERCNDVIAAPNKEVHKQSRSNTSKLSDKSYGKQNTTTSTTTTSECRKAEISPKLNNDSKNTIRSGNRTLTPVYANIRNHKDNNQTENQLNNKNTSVKSSLDRTFKRHNETPESKNNNKVKCENHSEKSKTTTGKEQYALLQRSKHKVRKEIDDNTLIEKKTLPHNAIDGNKNLSTNRRKLIDNTSSQHKNKNGHSKIVKSYNKENDRNKSHKNMNGEVLQNITEPVEAPVTAKHVTPLLYVKDVKPKINSEKLKKSKRNEYVINYDDKNGTVSSVCKINTGTGPQRRRIASIDTKEIAEVYNRKDKMSNRIPLRK